jgi:hypothetical protein
MYIRKYRILNLKILILILLILYSISFGKIKNKSEIDSTIPDSIPNEIVEDWEDYDSSINNYSNVISKIKSKLPPNYQSQVLVGSSKEAYLSACHLRRITRISPYKEQINRILFARHHDLGGPIIGFLEEMNSDGFITNMGKWGGTPCESKPPTYKPGGALCIIKFENYYPKFSTIIEDNEGVIRDPCVSFDNQKVIFAWSKDNNGYHLWESEINNPKNLHQLTNDPDGLTVSDYEPCYLQNGDILFNSSRCFGFVETYNNMTSNLFIINQEGKYLRRIGYDQVNTFYPVVMEDGKILYSRWEYNDRNAKTCLGLFSMNPDGTQQTEHFGNQTGWPATFIQARQIPGSRKIISVIGEYQGPYAGDLVIIDPNQSRNGLSAIQLVAPIRSDPEISSMESNLPLNEFKFQNPYPLDEEWFLVSWRKNKDEKYKIYFMNSSGERELIAWDQNQSLSQPIPIPLILPQIPLVPTYKTDYSSNKSIVSVNNVYVGYGTGKDVQKGSVKKIRVIALEYRTDPAFGNTGSQSYQMTPVGCWTSSWEAKHIIGEIPVDEDGSASFVVPPRTPLYIQLIDQKGRMIQTMRSWMTLQPGEEFSCFGCHEDKNEAPLSNTSTLSKTPKPLNRFYDIDETGYFSYPRYIQPILNENCVKSGCHDATHKSLDLRGDKIWTGTLLNANNRNACRFWNRSYINLTDLSKDYLSFIDVNTTTEGLKPNSVGSQKSKLMNMLIVGHNNVSLSDEEFEKIAAWIDLCIPHSGSYTDDMRNSDAAKYLLRLERRKKHEQLEEKNIEEFIAAGGYNAYVDKSSVKQDDQYYASKIERKRSGLQSFTASFRQVEKKLTFSLPSEGCISIIDLNGRQIMAIEISSNEYRENEKRTIDFEVPAGIYIVKFKGSAMIDEKIVSVL